MCFNQSINVEFVGRRYTTRPGAPAESVKSTFKKYIRESFSKCTGIGNIMKVGRKSVPGGWTGVEEATFTKSCSCSWQNANLWAGGPQSVSAAGCRNRDLSEFGKFKVEFNVALRCCEALQLCKSSAIVIKRPSSVCDVRLLNLELRRFFLYKISRCPKFFQYVWRWH